MIGIQQNAVTRIGAGNSFIGVTSMFLIIDASAGQVDIYLPIFTTIEKTLKKIGFPRLMGDQLYRWQISGGLPADVIFHTQDGSTIQSSVNTTWSPKGTYGTLTALSGNRWLAEERG